MALNTILELLSVGLILILLTILMKKDLTYLPKIFMKLLKILNI